MDKRYKLIRSKEGVSLGNEFNLQVEACKESIGLLNIRFSLSSASEIKVTLLTVLGKVEYFVRQHYYEGINSLMLYTNQLKKGVYFLEMMAEGRQSVMKVTIH